MMAMNWNQTVAEIGPRLFRYFSASFSAEQASDLTQETLIRLVRKYEAGAFDSRKGTLVMFAYGIARLVRLEAWKAAPTELPLNAETDAAADSESLEGARQVKRLRLAIQDLNEPQREILLLHIDEELTLQEIGTLMALPLNTVKSHVHRAKEVLREKLREEEALA
jgi:RNA polymerase sigma-70 factor (ECF subfamily)